MKNANYFFERDRAEFLLKERPPKRSNARFLTLNILQARFSDSKLNFNSTVVFKKSILRFNLSYLYQQVNKGIRKALKRTEGTLLIHSHAYKSFQYYFILVSIFINNTFFRNWEYESCHVLFRVFQKRASKINRIYFFELEKDLLRDNYPYFDCFYYHACSLWRTWTSLYELRPKRTPLKVNSEVNFKSLIP